MYRLAMLAFVALAARPTLAAATEPTVLAAAKPSEPLPTIELLTVGPGSVVWGRHGHLSLCLVYGDAKTDRCYHYALGDYAHPMNMVAGFFRGTHSFWAGPELRAMMLKRYRDVDRTIWSQPLPLDDAQKRRVLARLEHDILEDNKYYAYDHFENNCATLIRDIIDGVTDHALAKMDEPEDGRTYRDLARDGFYGRPLLLLITDVAMGRSTDRVPSYFDRMFLPEYLRAAIEKRFGVVPVPIYERRGPPPPTDGSSGRLLLALIILAVTAPAAIARWRGRFERIALGVAIVPYVLLGSVLLFLAIISPVPYVRWNETILVWLPSDVLLFALPLAKRRRYARARLIMLAAIAFALLVGLMKQPLWAPLLWPLVPAAIVGAWPRRHSGQGDSTGAP